MQENDKAERFIYNAIYKSILNNKYSKKKKETYGTYLEAFILFA